MASNFNIRDSNWDSLFSFYTIHSNLLTNIADSLDLIMLNFTNYISTRYLYNTNDANSIIYLIFLRPNFSEIDNYIVHFGLCYLSNYVLLTVDCYDLKSLE